MAATTPHTDHLPQRPDWHCRACHQPWPCANAKTDLLAEFHAHRSMLWVHLAGYMSEALHDLNARGQAPSRDLYQRFLGWIEHPT